jgi:hypothetical protein
VRISSRLPEAVAKAAINTAWTRAAEITVTQHAMQVLSDALRGYARIGLIGASRRQVQWVSGLLRDLTEYDCQDDPTVSAVIGMTTSRPSPPFRLSDIPIDRFIDLCDALTEARRCFGEEVVRWSSVIAALGTPTERREKLRQIRRDEIAPSMRQFSSDARADLKSILGDISGTQWASLALGGIAAAICMHYQVAPDETIAAAASAAALGAAGNVAKGIWDRKQKRRQTWMAFASALSDEGDRLADLK